MSAACSPGLRPAGTGVVCSSSWSRHHLWCGPAEADATEHPPTLASLRSVLQVPGQTMHTWRPEIHAAHSVGPRPAKPGTRSGRLREGKKRVGAHGSIWPQATQLAYQARLMREPWAQGLCLQNKMTGTSLAVAEDRADVEPGQAATPSSQCREGWGDNQGQKGTFPGCPPRGINYSKARILQYWVPFFLQAQCYFTTSYRWHLFPIRGGSTALRIYAGGHGREGPSMQLALTAHLSGWKQILLTAAISATAPRGCGVGRAAWKAEC